MNCCGNHNQQKSAGSDHGGLPSKGLSLCVLGLAAVVVAIFLFKISLTNVLFFGVLLACPLMHLFMMKDHSHNSGHKEKDD